MIYMIENFSVMTSSATTHWKISLCFSIDKFSFGVAHRGASIRIPRQVAEDGYGYFEVGHIIVN